MKKSLKYLPFLAALAFVGCSNDDEPANNSGGGEGPGYGYVAVNIMSSPGTRAEAFVDGFDNENKAKDGVFFIFDQEGNMYGKDGKAQRLTFTGSENAAPANDNIEKIYSAVLVIDGETKDPTADGTKPLQIFCVLNAPEGLESDETITSPAALMAKIGDYYKDNQLGNFIMTNSVYKDGENVVVGTPIAKVYKSATEAELSANLVPIYVERIVARIQTTVAKDTGGINNNFEITNPSVSIDGTNTTLKIVPTGASLVNIADKSYLFKKVDGLGTDYNWMWPTESYYRSYWEVVPVIGDGANELNFKTNDKTYTGIVSDNSNFNIDTYGGRPYYIQPNTVAEAGLATTEMVQYNEVKANERATALVMTAKLKKEDGSDLDYTLAYIRGGYTSSDKAFEVVGKHLATTKNWYMRTGTEDSYEYKPFDNTALEWKNNADLEATVPDLRRYEVVAQLKDGVEVYNLDGTHVTSIDGADNVQAGVNAYLRSKAAQTYQARVFTDGMCYYYVYVKHHTEEIPAANEGEDATTKVYNGIVRNHSYDLTLTSVQGIGTPIFDASDVIIPEKVKDETTFYLGAKVNVLAWRVVPTQIVEF